MAGSGTTEYTRATGSFTGMRLGYSFVLVFPAALAAGSWMQECEQCHPSEAEAHARTRHASAMVPALRSAFAGGLPNYALRESENGYEFVYQRVEKGVSVTAMRGKSRAEGLIEWVVGAGVQGQTPLVRTARGIRESRVSYFPKLQRYGITFGHSAGASSSPEAALGPLESSSDAQKCMGCHASAITRDLEPAVPGVQCWSCHVGAIEHARGDGKLPLNPGKLSAEAQVRLCGGCHRMKPPGNDIDPGNIRFQPLRLVKSRCFQSGGLRCTTCHTAHQDVRRDDAEYYNAKCRGCHAAATIHAGARQQANCIGCHMPRVRLHPALQFTDHFIRVARAGEPDGS